VQQTQDQALAPQAPVEERPHLGCRDFVQLKKHPQDLTGFHGGSVGDSEMP
jgi:hypothetical protein